MATRIKATVLKSRAEFDQVVDRLASATVDLRKLEAKRDERIQEVREKHEPDIAVLKVEIDAMALNLEKFAAANRDELMPGRIKSGETSLARFGFRFGNPTLKLLNKSWSWEKVVAELKARLLTGYVRTTEEADKEGLRIHLTPEQLAGVGCRVTQSETFYVEPKDQPSL
ncbi:MAG TPA: host-nuclease inhibitor Gam family protein [Opitutaceae bacterium]|jgi:phage host-nuclease inhibitor protein Gam|nr:host-nuclease inhibitor Gam family protein [Opitutaceae bacterium]